MKPKTYSSFIICWTPKGKPVGGTATAIKLAKKVNIEVINLALKNDYERIINFLQKQRRKNEKVYSKENRNTKT